MTQPRPRSPVVATLFSLALLTSSGTVSLAQESGESELDDAIEEAVENAEGIDEILVIGRRTDDGVPRVPINSVGSRDVFGPDRVKETGARDMNDLIVNIPAISTRPYNGGEAAAPSFSMRGLPDDGLTEYIHILIDGVPASPMQYGWTALSFLPLTTERVYAVDFIRGAHSVRYSPNTVGGILNFVTRPIPVEPTMEFRQTFGNLGYSSTLLSAGATQDGLGVLFTVVDRDGDGYRDDGEFSQTDWNLKLRLDTSATGWLASSISYFDSEHKAPGGLTLAEYDDDRLANARPKNEFKGDRTAIDLLWHEEIDEGWFEAFSYYTKTYRNLIAQRPHFGSATSLLDWTDDTFMYALGARGQHTTAFLGTDHTLFGGVRYQGEDLPHWRMKSSPFGGGAKTKTRDSDYSLDTWSAHLDDTFEPIENLTINAGLRFEYVDAEGDDDILDLDYRDDYSKLLPGVGASYLIQPNVAVFGNWFRGFRAPQAWGFEYEASADSLDFEESESTEFGLRFRDLAGFEGSITRWQTDFDDVGVFYTGFYENLGRIESDGWDFELLADIGHHLPDLRGLTISGSLTSQDSELRAGENRGNETPYAWQTKAAWTARYETPDLWVFSVGGTYVGDSYADEENTRAESDDGTIGKNPSRTLWDARVSKTFRLSENVDLELAAGATNFGDHRWFTHSRGGFFGGGKVAGAPRQTFASAAFIVNW